MPYLGEISRDKPGLFMFLIDQSRSMAETWGIDVNKTLSDGTADAVNKLLHDLIIRSTKADGVRSYFDVGIIGYGGDVKSALSEFSLADLPVSLNKLANTRTEKRRQKVEDGTGGLVEVDVDMPIWVDAVADGATPMCNAFNICCDIVEQWSSKYQASFPPIIINITDGKATDGNPEPIAERIQGLSTNDGNVLLFNIHLSSSHLPPIIYPPNEDLVQDEFGKSLFRMSSVLPQMMLEQASTMNYVLDNTARGFAFNADLVTLITFLDIGTRGIRALVLD
jgi:hypothetical protein